MDNCHSFFRNSFCRYFPCHKGIKEEEFNCLFCYCPLYYIEDCRGNYIMKGTLKVCTDCNIPHGKNGYKHILKMIKAENERRKNGEKGNNEGNSPETSK